MAEFIYVPSGLRVTVEDGSTLPAALFVPAEAAVKAAEPTKQELEDMAAELGIDVPKRATKAKLLELIAQAQEEAAVFAAAGAEDGSTEPDPRAPKAV